MIEAPHYSSAGAKRDAKFALPAEYFDGTVNEPVLHQAVKVYLNNQRQGTHMTKTRSFVSGGNQKPWKQKGTGRARQGSTRAPHWRGGGIVFGPSPRDYRTDIPRKVKQLARKSALNARAREGAVHVVERLAFRAPKTAQLVELLGSLGVDGRKVAGAHGGSQCQRLPQRPEPADGGSDAVSRGVGVRHPLVGGGGGRGGRAHRGDAGAAGRGDRGGEERKGRKGSRSGQGRRQAEAKPRRPSREAQGREEARGQGEGGQEDHGEEVCGQAGKKKAAPKKKGSK